MRKFTSTQSQFSVFSFQKFLLRFVLFPLWGLGGLGLGGLGSGFAQVFPVQMTPVFSSPYSSKISDYATSLDTRFQLIVNPTDVNINSRQVRLKMYISGNGIEAQTSEFATGINPIFINGGEIQTLTNVDLAGYFRLENLQGLSNVQYANPLPEGSYNICFEMFDFVTNQKISRKSCTNLYLILNDPPILNIPARNEQIVVSVFPNILFTWTPRSINATNVSYRFELKLLQDPSIDAQFGFAISPTVLDETQFGTTLLYNDSKPALIPGKRYAWRVRAISTGGLSENSVFKNDGYSEIFWFTYASNCPAPIMVFSEIVGSKSVKITWQSNIQNTKYQVQYRKRSSSPPSEGSGGGYEWFSTYTLNTQTTITDLDVATDYEFRVGATCEPTADPSVPYTFSGINNFSTPAAGATTTSAYSCGLNPAVNIANQTPITNLIVSETFTAGDFPVKVLELTGSNPYSGKGFIIVPYLSDTRIAVEFNNITVNTSYQLINGVVETTYNPSWNNVQDIQPLITDIIGSINSAIQNLQNLITQSQNGQSPINVEASNVFINAINNAMQLLANSGNYPPEIQQQIRDLTVNTFIASTNTTDVSQYVQTSQQLTQINALAASVLLADKAIEKLIAALKSFGTDTFIKCKKCQGTETNSSFDGSQGPNKITNYFGKKYACLIATLSVASQIKVITDDLNITPSNSNNPSIKKLIDKTKTVFNAFKPELLALINQNDELVECSVKYPLPSQICTINFSVSDATLAQIAEEISTCFVNKIQDYLIAAKADKRQNQSIEFENNGKVYKLNGENKAVLVASPLSDEQIDSGTWTDSAKDVRIRYIINAQGFLQYKAVGIRNNLTLATGKEANLVEISQNIKTKGNNFFIENKVTNGKETPANNSINLNENSEEFADGKKIAIDNKSSFFKIVSEAIGLTTSLLKTAKVEENTYLHTTETTATIHAPGVVTGTVEAGTRVITDITGLVVMVYDISVDKKARTDVANGLTEIKTKIGNNPSELLPILKEVIVEEATGNTIEDWTAINDSATDDGKKGHLATKGTVRTCITLFTSSVIITKLPEISKKLVKKIDDLAISTVDDLLEFINKTLAQKLEKISNIWSTKFPYLEVFEGRSFFEDLMGHYRYAKTAGWMHTGDISKFFKGVDFYKGTIVGNNIFADVAVSMKTTITTDVGKWLVSGPIKKNLGFLEDGLDAAKGISSNGKLMKITMAEVHIYMPKANITNALKTTWMTKLNTVNPKIKFEIKALEDFVN